MAISGEEMSIPQVGSLRPLARRRRRAMKVNMIFPKTY